MIQISHLIILYRQSHILDWRRELLHHQEPVWVYEVDVAVLLQTLKHGLFRPSAQHVRISQSDERRVGGSQGMSQLQRWILIVFVLGAFMFVPFGVTAIDLLSNNTYGHGTPTWEARKKVSWVLLQLFAPKVLRNSHPNTIPSIRLPYSSEWTKQA